MLAWDIWVRPALAHQKESSGQEPEHTLAVLCLPETPMSASAMFALTLIDLKAINCDIGRHDTSIFAEEENDAGAHGSELVSLTHHH